MRGFKDYLKQFFAQITSSEEVFWAEPKCLGGGVDVIAVGITSGVEELNLINQDRPITN